MPKTLNEREIGFNEGIEAAVEYHEKRARSADAASLALWRDEEDEGEMHRLRLRCVRVMSDHRSHGNALRKLRKLTDAESAEADIAAEMMER